MTFGRFFSIISLVGYAEFALAYPTDSVLSPSQLEEIEVVASGPRKVVTSKLDGRMVVNGDFLSEQPSLLGSGDPVALLRTLPSVASTQELQASFVVKGSATGSNTFAVDGIRVINPLHMLGFYSTYNPSFFKEYESFASVVPATESSGSGAYLQASSTADFDAKVSGKVAIGLIESHGAVRVPICQGKAAISVGARRSYLNLLFPNVLELDNSRLRYSFTDVNIGVDWRVTNNDLLRLSLFGNRDDMNAIVRHNGSKDGAFGWRNFAGGMSWIHKSSSLLASVSTFNNRFILDEGGQTIELPSSFSQAFIKEQFKLDSFTLSGEASYRWASHQYNVALENNVKPEANKSIEINLACSYRFSLFGHLQGDIGLRTSFYACSGYKSFIPQPRIHLNYEVNRAIRVVGGYGKHVGFERLVEESSVGLPVDFRICADKQIKPEDADHFELGIGGTVPKFLVEYLIEGWAKIMNHEYEYKGMVLSHAFGGYDPLNDLIKGKGRAIGISLSLMRQFGKLRGRVGYTLSKSMICLARDNDQWYPSSHDRPHDLNVTISYSPLQPLTVGASFVYASGKPYTSARWGYIIDDNLICEYNPHNSSRLPSYKRLDFSADWKFNANRHGIVQSLSLSVYNLLASHNVLFRYFSYSSEKGIYLKQSTMKSLIPSLTYKVSF